MMVVYRITNLVTGASYIGITSYRLSRRWNDHRCRLKTGDTPLYRAMRKYGIDSFQIEVVASIKNFAALKATEIEIIAQEHTHVRFGGYNITYGGDGTLGWIPSELTREKIRAASTLAMADPDRRVKLSLAAKRQMANPEMRATLSRANKSRKHTDETKRKVSEAGKRRAPRTAETCAKLAAALRGRSRPPEVKEKIRAAKLGKKMSPAFGQAVSDRLKGKPKSESHRAAMRAAWVIRRQREERYPCAE